MTATADPEAPLHRALSSGRIHSAYLLSGPAETTRAAALRFARGLVCRSGGDAPCEDCADCRRSSPRDAIVLDGSGRKGPLLRHVGDHADLLWVERGADDTRVRTGQVRALQSALRLATSEGGRRAAVVADAEQLNPEAQNALLRLLEEPPPRTTLVLVTATAAGMLATVRSRCQRIVFPPESSDPLSDPENAELVNQLAALERTGVPEILDWAARYRGTRAVAAAEVQTLLETASAWVRARVAHAVAGGAVDVRRELDAFREIGRCRRAVVQRNANPQMVAERALLALRDAVQS